MGELEKEPIKPEEFLEYARENHKEYKKNPNQRNLVNVYGCIAKGFCSQLDNLFTHIKPFIPKNEKPICEECGKESSMGFAGKFDWISKSGLVAPEELKDLYEIRNELEHGYKVRSADAISPNISSLQYFITEAKNLMKTPIKEVQKEVNKILDEIKEDDKHSNYYLFIKKFFQNYPKKPSKLTQEDAHLFLADMIKDEYGASTVKHSDDMLKFLYQEKLNQDYVSYSDLPKVEKKKYQRINHKDWLRMLSKIPQLRTRMLVRLIWHNGFTTGQLVSLKISDLHKCKLSTEGKEELSEYLEVLSKRKNLEDLAFPNPQGVEMKPRAIQRIFEKIPVSPKVTPRGLRHNSPNVKHTLSEDEFITNKEFNLLLLSAGNEKIRDCLYFIYHFDIGMKQFLSIRYDNVNFNKKIIRVKPTHVFKKDRVDMDDNVSERLKKFCENEKIDSGKIFRCTDKTIYDRIKAVAKRVNLSKKVDYHVLSKSRDVSESYLSN